MRRTIYDLKKLQNYHREKWIELDMQIGILKKEMKKGDTDGNKK